jgi:hypothetical protein
MKGFANNSLPVSFEPMDQSNVIKPNGEGFRFLGAG